MTSIATSGGSTGHVEACMGTVFSIDIRDIGDWSDAIADVCTWLHHVDAVFSTYRADSDISRVRAGELSVSAADPLVSSVIDLCLQAQHQTSGYFTALLDGRLDPTGLVKGWAIEHASELLRSHGSDNHAIGGGGDLQIAGEAAPGEPWRVGISDPHRRERIVAVVTGRDFAVATSGLAERGPHIINPFTNRPATELAAATVVGSSLTTVDAYATAAFAMGAAAVEWLDACPGHHGLVVTAAGTLRATSRFPGSLSG